MRDSLEHHKVSAAACFAIGDDSSTSRPHCRCDLNTRRVAGIDDSHAIRFEPLIEESRLGLEVGLHRRVVVEMILGEIGKTRCVKSDAGHALLIECVARSLHRKMSNAVRTLQFAKHDMQRFRVVRGKSRFKVGVALVAGLEAESSQAYCVAAVLAPEVAKEAHRRGLAVGAGDGCNRAWTTGMKIGRQSRIESSNVPNSQDHDFFALVLVEAQSFVARAFRYGDGLRAFRGGLRAERNTILYGARQGAEQVAVANVSGIVSNAEDEQIFRFGRVRLQCPAAVLRPKIT